MTEPELEAFIRETFQNQLESLFTKVNGLTVAFVEFRTEVRGNTKVIHDRLPQRLRCEEHTERLDGHETRLDAQSKSLRRYRNRFAAVAAVFTGLGVLIGWAGPAIAEHILTKLKP